MFDLTSRTTYDRGIYFYEKDIIYDNHIYAGDIEIECTVDYLASGFGFLLFPEAGLDLDKQQFTYLIKLGTKNITAYKRYGNSCHVIKTQSVTLAPPLKSLVLTLKKINNTITIYDNLSKIYLMTFELDSMVLQQSIGFYSAKNNRILDLNVYSKIPKQWTVNMANTQGGRISFTPHTIYLERCINNAEWLQEVPGLEPGKYYLNYHLSTDSDIKAYVYPVSDLRTKDKEKNILNDDSTFIVTKTGNYVIKFAGKKGILSQVSLTDSCYSNYIATSDEPISFEGSYITLNMNNIIQFTVHFKLYAKSPLLNYESYIVSNLVETMSGITLRDNQEYTLTYDKATQTVKLFSNDGALLFNMHLELTMQLYLFKNMETRIDLFEIVNQNNEIIDLLTEHTGLNNIPNTLLSPIIVTGLDGMPYDLSASYRILPVGKEHTYYFTNYEREIFPATSILMLESTPKSVPNAISVYGIPVTAQINKAALYQGTLENPNDLSAYCNQYVLLDNIDYHYEDNKTIYIDATILPNYQQFVVDYLKSDSYAINYNFKIQCYEVDTSADEYNILYNAANTYTLQSTTQTDNAFYRTDLKAYPKHYVVLEKE